MDLDQLQLTGTGSQNCPRPVVVNQASSKTVALVSHPLTITEGISLVFLPHLPLDHVLQNLPFTQCIRVDRELGAMTGTHDATHKAVYQALNDVIT